MKGATRVLGAIGDQIIEGVKDSGAGGGDTIQGLVANSVAIAMFVIGLIAVAMIIIGGVQYSLSQGDAAKVKKAKDTILYGVIGLVIAILAFPIINFVLGNI